MNQTTKLTKTQYIQQHSASVRARAGELYAMGIIEKQPAFAPATPKPIAAPVVPLRGKTDPERRVEKYVRKHHANTGRWPTLDAISRSTHLSAGDLVGIILKSTILNYTVSATEPKTDMDPVLTWTIELTE